MARGLSLIRSRSLGASRAVVAGCARPVVSLMSTAGDRRLRFHVHEPSGCWNRSGGCARELAVEHAANERWRRIARVGMMKNGRRFGRPTEPDSRLKKPTGKDQHHRSGFPECEGFRGYVQGYNAQAVVTEQQIVIAAEVNIDSPGFGHLELMIAAAREKLQDAGVTEQTRTWAC